MLCISLLLMYNTPIKLVLKYLSITPFIDLLCTVIDEHTLPAWHSETGLHKIRTLGN